MRMTDRKAVEIALRIAIDTENDLIGGFSHMPNMDKEPGVITARRRVAAFRRVLSRYYEGKPLSLHEIFAEKMKDVPTVDVMEQYRKDRRK